MKRSAFDRVRRSSARWAKALLMRLPTPLRSRLQRRAIDLRTPAHLNLELTIASTEAELEACFALLHNAYVASGLMRPHPSGLRVTPYHALSTTTTLCAKVDGLVVGTLSIVREGVFGLPMQSAFDVSAVRQKGGRLAEISALAIHPRFRKTGGTILFPLMKFMYEYCTTCFDTRHLLIAVHPSHIELYESLLFFQRLTAATVENYDFVNGAPAVGATLDLQEAPAVYERAYGGRKGARNLHAYFVHTRLPSITLPARGWHVSNDPVLTPALMQHFFNQRTDAFALLDPRRRLLLRSIYPGAAWAACLPAVPAGSEGLVSLRRHPRFSMRCPARITFEGDAAAAEATLIEISGHGFSARSSRTWTVGLNCSVSADLGPGRTSCVQARVVRGGDEHHDGPSGFEILVADAAWQRCTEWLEASACDTRSHGGPQPVADHHLQTTPRLQPPELGETKNAALSADALQST